jgi:hypothetical protein
MYSIIDILKFHDSLLHGLESMSRGSKVGEVLQRYSKDFREIYSKYASLLPTAVTMSSRELCEFLRSRIEFCPSDSAVFLKFISLLHGPFQRRQDICISVRKVLEVIPLEHPDYQSVLNCWKSFKITASFLRELLCRSESEEELYAVESQLVDYQVFFLFLILKGPSLDDFGLIVLKGPFNVKSGRRRKYRFVYLLQKCILILKGKKSFFGSEKLTNNAIRMNSAESIYLDEIILLDKTHYRAVASWELHDSKIFYITHQKMLLESFMWMKMVPLDLWNSQLQLEMKLSNGSLKYVLSAMGILLYAPCLRTCPHSEQAAYRPSYPTIQK